MRIVMYQRATETRRYKILFWLITIPLLPVGIVTNASILLGEYAEKINYWLMDIRENLIQRTFLFFKWDGVEIEKPSCYRPNNDLYQLCQGADNPVDFAENVCIRCNLYEDMTGEGD